MTQRPVDVLVRNGKVAPTCPITLGELADAPDDAAYEAKALGQWLTVTSRLMLDFAVLLPGRTSVGAARWRPAVTICTSV